MDQAAHGSGIKGSGIGQPVRRREDLRLVRGAGRYTADENLPGQLYAVMLRSPHAHARIRAIATGDAKAMPGVRAVLTGADFLADGLKPIPHIPWSPHPAETQLHNSDGTPPFELTRTFHATGRQGALCRRGGGYGRAETVNAAKDAAERIAIDYDVLPAVAATADAARAGMHRMSTTRRARTSASTPSLATPRRPPPLLPARRM